MSPADLVHDLAQALRSLAAGLFERRGEAGTADTTRVSTAPKRPEQDTNAREGTK